MGTDLPNGWLEVDLAKLVDYKKGKKPRTLEKSFFKTGLPYLDIKAIETGVDHYFADEESSNLTSEDDIVVVWDGARAGWVGKSREGALGSTLMSLKPKIDRNYLYRFLQTQFEYIQANHRGTGIPHVDPDIFWSIKVPVAPFAEQHRIVAKLEEAMEKIDRSRARLERIPQILKRFRQSVLAAAVSGKLTEEWRSRNRAAKPAKAHIEELISQRRTKNPKVKLNLSAIEIHAENSPTTWHWTRLLNIADVIGGVTKGRKFNGKKTITLPYLRVANVQDGFLDLGEIKKIEVLPEDRQKYLLIDGDILFTEGGDRDKLGRGSVWNNEINDCIHQNHIFRARVNTDFVLPKYLSLFTKSDSARSYFFENASQTVNLASINLTSLANVPILVPPIQEQHEIVRHVESLYSKTDKIVSRYAQALLHVDKLEASLLARAFRGELVLQNDKDESAPELLERLKLGRRELIASTKSRAQHGDGHKENTLESNNFSKRKVLATYIINQSLSDQQFGDTKFEKLLHLCDYHAIKRHLGQRYYQQAAGPYDNSFTRTYFIQVGKSKWFNRKRQGTQFAFSRGVNHSKSLTMYDYFSSEELRRVDMLIAYFKKYSYEQPEIISTLYAVWNNRIIKNLPVDDELLKADFLEWDSKKAKYKDRLTPALAWMRKEGIVPDGWGKLVERSKSRKKSKGKYAKG